jgi:hypothetical protein
MIDDARNHEREGYESCVPFYILTVTCLSIIFTLELYVVLKYLKNALRIKFEQCSAEKFEMFPYDADFVPTI